METKSCLLALVALVLAPATLLANPNDLNKDKKISWEEFEILKKKEAETNNRAYNENNVRTLFNDKDLDGDGSLTYKEFNTHPFDINGDKKISIEEFLRVHRARAERAGRPLNEENLKRLFAAKDQNRDGSLDFQELAFNPAK